MESKDFVKLLPRCLSAFVVIMCAYLISNGGVKEFLYYGLIGVAVYLVVIFLVSKVRRAKNMS